MSVKRLIRIGDVVEKTGLSKSFIYMQMNTGNFLLPMKVGVSKSSFWVSAEVDAWIDTQIESCPRGLDHDYGRELKKGNVLVRG